MHACMHTSIPMAPRERLRPLSPHDRPWSPATGAAQLGGQGLTDSVSAPRTRDRCERRWPNQTMIADERAGRPNQTMIADERAEDSRACTRKCTRIHPHSEWSFFWFFAGKPLFCQVLLSLLPERRCRWMPATSRCSLKPWTRCQSCHPRTGHALGMHWADCCPPAFSETG